MSKRVGLRAIRSIGARVPIVIENLYAGLIKDGILGETPSPPARIVKIRLSDFSRVGILNVSSILEDVTSLAAKNGFLYCGMFYYPNTVSKVDLSTFSFVSELELASGDDELFPDRTMVIVGDYLYLATGSGGRIIKIDLNTFTRVGALNFAPTSEFYSITTDGTYLYAGDYIAMPGRIMKIRISDFTHVATLTLASGENYLRTLAIDENYLYSGHCPPTGAGFVVRIALSTFTRDARLNLAADETSLVCTHIKGGYLYLGLATSPAKIVKINRSTFTKEATLTLGPGENNVRSITSDNTYLYCGLLTAPGKIVRIRLSDFSKVDTLDLAPGEDYIGVLTAV